MKTNILACLVSGFCLTAPVLSSAQSIQILGFTNDGQRTQLRAKVDLNGKEPASVTAYSYNMTDGYTVTNNTYEFVRDGNDTYLSADVFYHTGTPTYTHRVAITFTDGTMSLSPVMDENFDTKFMWLGDFNYAAGVSGWDANHPPVVDREIDPTLNLTLDGVRYYKAVSNHAPGYLVYKFPEAQFTKFQTYYGVQDTQADGDVEFKFYTGTDVDQTSESQLKLIEPAVKMYSLSNPNRNGADCIAEKVIQMNGICVLRFQFNEIDNNWGDHAHLAMARLYMEPDIEMLRKEPQTVTFETPVGTLTEPVTLKANAPGGKIHYRIITGRDLATIEDGQLKPVWGKSGTVVVEAVQFGNENYMPGAAYQTFTVDMKPDIEMLDVYTPSISEDGKTYAYLYVDTKGKTLDKLDVTFYNNARNRVKTGNRDILSQIAGTNGPRVVELELSDYDNQVLRVAYSYTDSEKVDSLAYWHKEGSYDYMSDLTFTYGNGYGSFPGANKSFGGDYNNVLAIGSNNQVLNTYAKGFGLHAAGWIEIAPEVLTPYNRVILDIGSQYPQGFTNQVLTFELLNGNTVLDQAVNVSKPANLRWDYPINNQQKLRINANPGSDGNGNDHVCIGAPRLYYTPTVKSAQSIDWVDYRPVVKNEPATLELGAISSNGFPIYYRIVRGKELATISGDKLVINGFPAGGAEIVVDAYQPGDNEWAPAEVKTCVFGLVRGIEVQKGEYVELKNSDVLDRLIIHADKRSSGEVSVKSGLIDVKTLVLKYTFNPGEWTHIAFPADIDIEKVSNLSELGYKFNAFGVPGYYIKEYDTEASARNPEVDAWKTLESPSVKGLKGYIMSIDASLTDEPVEVTFTIDNAKVDLANITRALGLTIDFSRLEPGKKQTVSVSSANPDIQSNSLTVEVTFDPTDASSLPLNHEKALEAMRHTFVDNNKAIRLTLPDQTPARVVFFDEKGKKIVKAVRYVSPYVIDLGDLKPGKYNMVVSYGPATKTIEIEL